MSSNSSLDRLTDQALLDQFGDLVQQHQLSTANLLRHIDAIDRRKLWAQYGHPSMFDFCVSRHHMSESTAFKRIGAARTARRFPVLFEMVGNGELHLSGIHRLKAHLTRENHEQVLAQAKHMTLRQIEKLVARLAPQPDAPSRLRALPNRTTTPPSRAAAAQAATTLAAAAIAPPLMTPNPAAPSRPAAGATESEPAVESEPVPLPHRRAPDPVPLSPSRYRLQVTISESTYDKLKQLQDLLAHRIPNGDPAVIVERALDLLLKQVRKKKTGLTDKPRAPRPSSKPAPTVDRTRHLEAALRREVWSRDEGRCGFVGKDGRRCNETRGLEFAHVQPWAKGGANNAENLGLRCRVHNALEAERDYSSSFMARKRAQKPLKVREPVAQYFHCRVGEVVPACGYMRVDHHDPGDPLGDVARESALGKPRERGRALPSTR